MAQTLSDVELAHLVEFGEGEAVADMYLSAPPEMGIRVERVGSAVVLLAETLDIVLANRVLGLGMREPATEAMLDDILARYRQAGIRNFAFQLSPVAQPPELPAWLKARQLRPQDNWAKVYRASEPSVAIPTELRVERIGPEYASAFSEVACTAFEMPMRLRPWIEANFARPGWHYYLAFDGERPVATGALFVREGVGWLGLGSTLPTDRRRGAQGAILARRIRDGAEMGCRWLVTETGADLPERPNPSYRNMMRTGFQLAYLRPSYMLTPPPLA
jgi:hypothetical protein